VTKKLQNGATLILMGSTAPRSSRPGEGLADAQHQQDIRNDSDHDEDQHSPLHGFNPVFPALGQIGTFG
jgi:hypothetical protein